MSLVVSLSKHTSGGEFTLMSFDELRMSGGLSNVIPNPPQVDEESRAYHPCSRHTF